MGFCPRPRGAALADNAPHLFLSYSSQDSAWVAELAENLNICGVDVWLDAWELRVGDDLHERISEAIEKSRFVGVVVTEHFNASRWITGEVHQALTREKRENRPVVLPLIAADVEPPAVLSSKKFLNFAKDYFGSLVRLVGRIHSLPTTTLENVIREEEPDDLYSSFGVLHELQFFPLHIVGEELLEQILKAGGRKDPNGVVRFERDKILKKPGISRSLRAFMLKLPYYIEWSVPPKRSGG